MKKADLITVLNSKFTAVLSITQQGPETNGVRYYIANVFDVSGNAGNTFNVWFFVKDEGTAAEAAYWGGAEPKPAPGPATFADEATTWLRGKIDVTVSGKIIRMFDQFSVDNVQQRAQARLTLEDTGTETLSHINIALWKQAGAFQYKIIT